jgi:hypothetical protein
MPTRTRSQRGPSVDERGLVRDSRQAVHRGTQASRSDGGTLSPLQSVDTRDPLC